MMRSNGLVAAFLGASLISFASGTYAAERTLRLAFSLELLNSEAVYDYFTVGHWRHEADIPSPVAATGFLDLTFSDAPFQWPLMPGGGFNYTLTQKTVLQLEGVEINEQLSNVLARIVTRTYDFADEGTYSMDASIENFWADERGTIHKDYYDFDLDGRSANKPFFNSAFEMAAFSLAQIDDSDNDLFSITRYSEGPKLKVSSYFDYRVKVMSVTEVPEPATIVLMGLGLIAMRLSQRRTRTGL